MSDIPQDVLIVTFNEMWFDSVEGFWGEKVLNKIGVASRGVVSKGPNWFPQDETLAALAPIVEHAKAYRRVILYGFSMGAYGAIKYSRLFDNPVVLAFSPQASINPKDLGGLDDRYEPFYNSDVHQNMLISESDIRGRVLAFYDPYLPPDKLAADLLPSCVERVPLRFASHETVLWAASASNLAEMLTIASQMQFKSQDLLRILKANRSTSVFYARSLLIKLTERKHMMLGAKLVSPLRSDCTGDVWTLRLIANILEASAQPEKALKFYERAQEIEPDERMKEKINRLRQSTITYRMFRRLRRLCR